MFTWNRRYDASSLPVAYIHDGQVRSSNLLIDCGEGTQIALKEKRMEPEAD